MSMQNQAAAAEHNHHHTLIAHLIGQLNSVILGNKQATKMALVCLLARGHLLIEDLPGVGKTTLAKNLAAIFGLSFKRIQFTNDLLPSDILGVNIFNSKEHSFNFKAGPIFTEALLADEINRANPKTQSALLEAMEENKVSIDGESRTLPQPFFVIATQNPLEQSGTYPLPESQLDRFLFRLSLGYPDAESEKRILKSPKKTADSPTQKGLNRTTLNTLFQAVAAVRVSDAVVDYLQTILQQTRESAYFVTGLSPRAGLLWLNAARAHAFVEKRDYVLPEDIRNLAPYIVHHRLQVQFSGHTKEQFKNLNNQQALEAALKNILNSIEII